MTDHTPIISRPMRCKTCGKVYEIALGYPIGAPHGPDWDCVAPDGWEKIPGVDVPRPHDPKEL